MARAIQKPSAMSSFCRHTRGPRCRSAIAWPACFLASMAPFARATKASTSADAATWRTSPAESSSIAPFMKGKGGCAPFRAHDSFR